MTDKQFDDSYTCAGAWFVALYMEVIISKIKDLNTNKELKKQLIKNIYNNGDGPDKYESGTNSRVNSLMRIVNENRTIEALEKVINSKRVNRDFPEAVNTAEYVLTKIKNKEILT